jgi:urea transport system permease protein
MGVLFVGVVMGFPNGLAGVYTSHVKPWLFGKKKVTAPVAAVEEPKVDETKNAAVNSGKSESAEKNSSPFKRTDGAASTGVL